MPFQRAIHRTHKNKKMRPPYYLLGISTLLVGLFLFWGRPAQALTRHITFPVLGSTTYQNDFNARRVGHLHEGNDVFGKKMQPLVAAVNGIARYVAYPEPSYGWYVELEDATGYTYRYIHINNDTPGTDNGKGGPNFAYAPSVDSHWPVVAGQVIAYLGDSGNAENTSPHLHFEIRTPDGKPINPFFSLEAATKLKRAVTTPVLPFEILPYGKFSVGANIATGDVASELVGDEIVVGAGAGSSPHIRILTPDGNPVGGFFLLQNKFRGGVDVTVGDMNGDGTKEIITALGPGAKPLIQIFDRQGGLLSQFLAYAEKFRGGVRVSTADLDGDGIDEIITGPGRGGGPDVHVYRITGESVTHFYAYAPEFRGGVDVSGISATATSPGMIVTAPGAGGGPDVRVFTSTGALVNNFYSGDRTFHGGLRVSTNVNADTGIPTIFTVPMSASRGLVQQLTLGGQVLSEQQVFEKWWIDDFDVAVDDSTIYVSSARNNRRGSIMKTDWHTTPDFYPFIHYRH